MADLLEDGPRSCDDLAVATGTHAPSLYRLLRALADYERRRNEDAFPRFDENCRAASFQPPSQDELRLQAALRSAGQDDIDTFMGARFGTLPREAFFNPENLGGYPRRSKLVELPWSS